MIYFINCIVCLYLQLLYLILFQEDEDDEDDDDDNSSPSLCAAQTLDCLAINLPPEKYMSALMNHLSPALESNNPALLKGAFEAMAVSAEGMYISNSF